MPCLAHVDAGSLQQPVERAQGVLPQQEAVTQKNGISTLHSLIFPHALPKKEHLNAACSLIPPCSRGGSLLAIWVWGAESVESPAWVRGKTRWKEILASGISLWAHFCSEEVR